MFSSFSRGFSKISALLIVFVLVEATASNQILPSSRKPKEAVKNCKVPDFKRTLYSLQSSCPPGDYCYLEAGQEVLGNGTLVSLKCSDPYVLREKLLDFVVCFDGVWYPKDHSCLRTCSARHFKTIELTCSYNGVPVSCHTNIRVGTTVSWSCKPGYQTDTKRLPNRCLKDGRWKFTLSECTPERRLLTAKIELGHQRNVSDFVFGEEISLSCHVDGYPFATSITWLKDGQTIRGGGRIAFNETKHETLTISDISIQNATLADSGTYQCRAENDHSSSTFSADIFVYSFQSNVSGKLLTFQVGSNASLLCEINVPESYELPRTVRWFKSGQQILMNKRIKITHLNCTLTTSNKGYVEWMCRSELIIERTGLNDSDEYMCEIEGEPFNITKSLSIYVPQEISAEIKMAKTSRIPRGSDIEIPCEVDGFPRPLGNWYVNGYNTREWEMLFEKGNIFIERYNNNKQLVFSIHGAEVFNSGFYTCKAHRGDIIAESTVEIIVSATEQCSMPVKIGPCYHYTIRYVFDPQHNKCTRFFYGGCQGNLNRFESEDMCKATCLPGADKEVCQLPLSNITNCRARYPVWYYDAKLEMCEQFRYYECIGNANWFKTENDCKQLCVNKP